MISAIRYDVEISRRHRCGADRALNVRQRGIDDLMFKTGHEGAKRSAEHRSQVFGETASSDAWTV